MTRNGNDSPWTNDRVATLKRLWPTDASLEEIARCLGGDITRHAVAGKAFRLKLPRRADPIGERRPSDREFYPRWQRRARGPFRSVDKL
jgi:GcrA cell cycle regulator